MSSSTFAELGVSDDVCAVLATRGITSPFPVQELVLPVARTGRDVLVSSPTGSGKTLAFGLPLIERLTRSAGQPSSLILAPTRELASQIEEELSPLAAARKLRIAVCYGGVGLEQQAKRAARADILVATPGRLLDLARQRKVSLAGITTLVLDEADRMLDMGFLPQVQAIVRQVPRDRHTMFFSATLDGAVGTLAEQFTRDAERLRMREARSESGETLSERLSQEFVACTPSTRTDELLTLINGEDDLVLVFCRTRRGAGRLAERLDRQGLSATSMHGDLSQVQREKALRRFANGSVRDPRGDRRRRPRHRPRRHRPGRQLRSARGPGRLHAPCRTHRPRRPHRPRRDAGHARARRPDRTDRRQPRARGQLGHHRVRARGAARRLRLAPSGLGVLARAPRASPPDRRSAGSGAREPGQARQQDSRRLIRM